MPHPRDQLIEDVHRQLSELRESTQHSRALIDEIQSNLNLLSSAPAAETPATETPAPSPEPQPVQLESAPVSEPAPKPAPAPLAQAGGRAQKPRPWRSRPQSSKPQLSTEQRTLRWAAILGSVITFVGACFGIALAIQSGLLGPAGRATGAALLALILLGIGIRIDRRKGPNSGVMALYVTSFLIFALDLIYIGVAKEWVTPGSLVVLSLALWVAYLALAKWRNNLKLLLAMCIIFVFYSMPLITEDAYINALVLVPPILALPVTWRMYKDASPQLLTAARTASGLLLAWQTMLVAEIGDFYTRETAIHEPVHFAVALPLIGVVLLVVGEMPFKAPETEPMTSVIPGVITPAALLAVSYSMLSEAGSWLLVLTAAVVTCLVVVLRPRAGTQFQPELLTGWLMVSPFTFLPLFFAPYDPDRASAWVTWIPVITLLVLATVGLVFLSRLPVDKVPVLGAWAIMVFLGTSHLLTATLNPLIPAYSISRILQGVALAALLVVGVTRKELWRGLPVAARNALAGFALVMEMVAVVTIIRGIGELISPSEWNSTTLEFEGNEVSFYIGHMIVSISWMALASWLLVKRSANKDAKAERTAGLVIAIVATAKLVLFDMAALSGIPRVLTFIVCGLLLIAVAAKGAQRKQSWQIPPEGSRNDDAEDTEGEVPIPT